jgi:hypothetical protein
VANGTKLVRNYAACTAMVLHSGGHVRHLFVAECKAFVRMRGMFPAKNAPLSHSIVAGIAGILFS